MSSLKINNSQTLGGEYYILNSLEQTSLGQGATGPAGADGTSPDAPTNTFSFTQKTVLKPQLSIQKERVLSSNITAHSTSSLSQFQYSTIGTDCTTNYVALIADNQIIISNDGIEWQNVLIASDFSGQIKGLVHNGDIFILVTESKVYVSQTGATWFLVNTTIFDGLTIKAIFCCNNIVYINAESTHTDEEYYPIYQSTDGINYTKGPFLFTPDKYLVYGHDIVDIFYNGNFYILMVTETVYNSLNMIIWYSNNIIVPGGGTTAYGYSPIRYTGSYYSCLIKSGDGRGGYNDFQFVSSDGTNWNPIELDLPVGDISGYVTNGLVNVGVINTLTGDSCILVMNDKGIIKQKNYGNSIITGMFWDGNKFIGYISSGEEYNAIYSYDALTWYQNSVQRISGIITLVKNLNQRNTISFPSTRVLLFCGSIGILYYPAKTGFTDNIIPGFSDPVYNCIYNGKMYIIVSQNSPQGFSLSYMFNGDTEIKILDSLYAGGYFTGASSVCWTGKMFVLTLNNPDNTIMKSYDGINWIPVKRLNTANERVKYFTGANCCVWNQKQGVLLAGGYSVEDPVNEGELFVRTTDGEIWTSFSISGYINCTLLCTNGDLYIASVFSSQTGKNTIIYSTNGYSLWKESFEAVLNTENYTQFYWNGYIFVALISNSNQIGVSKNGKTWDFITIIDSITASSIIATSSITYMNEMFILTAIPSDSTDYAIYTSVDGTIWTRFGYTSYSPSLLPFLYNTQNIYNSNSIPSAFYGMININQPQLYVINNFLVRRNTGILKNSLAHTTITAINKDTKTPIFKIYFNIVWYGSFYIYNSIKIDIDLDIPVIYPSNPELSYDGITLVDIDAPIPFSWCSTYNGSLYLIGGGVVTRGDPVLYRSIDMETWLPCSTPDGINFIISAYWNGEYFLISGSSLTEPEAVFQKEPGISFLIQSYDGITWDRVNMGTKLENYGYITNLVYIYDTWFFTCPTRDNTNIYTFAKISNLDFPDTLEEIASLYTSGNVAYGNNIIAICGRLTATGPLCVMSSVDGGTAWTTIELPISIECDYFTWSGGVFNITTYGNVLTSVDCVNWSTIYSNQETQYISTNSTQGHVYKTTCLYQEIPSNPLISTTPGSYMPSTSESINISLY